MNSTFTLKTASALGALILFALCDALSAREGPVTAVQNALVREQFLAGEPSGVLDESTHAALRQYQNRHLLPVTGEIDSATLQALQGSLADQTQGSTRSPLPKSVVASDREFLHTLETAKNAGPVATAVHHGTGAAASDPGTAPAAKPASPLASAARHEASGRDEPKADSTPPMPKARPRVAVAASNDGPFPQRRNDPESNAPTPATRNAISPAMLPGSQDDSDLRTVSRVIVTRTKGPDGRTYVSERRITTSDGSEPRPEVAENVHSSDNGFFHRLFHHD